MDSISDRCLICYSIVTSTVAKKKRRNGRRGGESLSSSSVLLQQLDNIFILKELLEIPSHNLETFLKDCGKPEMWICICPNCEGLIEEAKRINNEMIEVRKRFNSVKKQVIEAIRKSKAEQDDKANSRSRKRKLPTRITDQSRSFVNIHNYGDFTDPFISGDKRASQLIKKNSSDKSANDTEVVEVKAEWDDYLGNYENEELFFNLDYTDSYEDDNETDSIQAPIKGNLSPILPPPPDKLEDVHMPPKSCKRFPCHYCPKIFQRSYDCKRHMKSVHKEQEKHASKNCEIKKFPCQYCSKIFQRSYDCKRHMKSVHKDQEKHASKNCESKKFQCQYCSKIFQRSYDCKRHIKTVHKEQEKHASQNCESKKILSCSACKDFEDADVEKLIIHWKSCKGIAASAIADDTSCDKVVTCQICNSFQASSSEQLEFFEHLLICNKNITNDQQIPLSCRIFECNICPPKTYFTLDGFIQHFVEHRKNIYKCTKCPQRYPAMSQIHLHWKSDHRDAVKNVEPSCRFSVDKSVPEICWWCHVCNQKFPNEDLRAEHIASAHESDVPEKIHICHQCSKAYSCNTELKLHEETEHVIVMTNGRVFECDQNNGNPSTEDRSKKSKVKSVKITKKGKLVDNTTCGICFKTFVSRSAKFQHQCSRLSGEFPCRYCAAIFQRRHDCERHMQSVHKEQENRDRKRSKIKKNLSCPVCKVFKFVGVEELIIHWKSCEGIATAAMADNTSCENAVTCQICNSFKSSLSEQDEFFEHMLICGKNLTTDQPIPLSCRIFECNICPPKTYFTLDGFIQHFAEHSRNIYKCTKCPKRCSVVSHIHSHWIISHRSAVKTVKPSYRFSVDKSVPELCWWCHVCNQKFPNEDLRAEHIASAHEPDVSEKIHICQQCSKAYSCQTELKLHEGTEHVKTNLSVFECDVCKMRFATSHQLKTHRMRKHRLDLLVCDVCGMECNSPNNLKNHMLLHADVKEFACQQCDKSFTSAQYLKNHEYKVHTPRDAQINPLVCKYCEKSFNNKSYLNQHVAGTHEGRFRIFCNLCSAGFFHNSQLKKHMAKKHQIGERKSYPCTEDGCDRKFHSLKALREHVDRHKGNPRYKCRFCSKEFYESSRLRRHEQIHTNAESKPYVCEICAKRFPVRNYLYIHMKSHKRE